MARPTTDPRKAALSIRLPERFTNQLKVESQNQGTTVTAIVQSAIAVYFSQQKTPAS